MDNKLASKGFITVDKIISLLFFSVKNDDFMNTNIPNKNIMNFNNSRNLLVIASLIAGFVFDTLIPLGVAAGIIYIIPILITYDRTSINVTYLTTLAGAILTIVGLIISPEGGELWKVLANRALSLLAILSVGFSIIKIKQKRAALLMQTQLAKKAEHKAILANQAKSNFLSAMHHELRTPLNSIIGFSQLLQVDDKLEQHQKEDINFIYDAGLSLLGLINTTLEFVELQDDGNIKNKSSFRINELIDELVNDAQMLLKNNSITIDTDNVINFPVKTLVTDRQVVKKILAVILENAILYNSEKGTVTLHLELTDEHRMRVKVSDTGIGIDPSRASELFTPFSRLGMENSTIPGMGLGLAKANMLVKVINAKINFHENVGGVGSVFCLDLPVQGMADEENI